ncbi:protein HIDE1 isoform X2 [Dromaius novaehollandiae]|uniref:protein HIDE1 isoform X2 n=2 Tax=Dromaius novaehollandiae TaxID=8790 RepID=UPI00311EA9C1
MKLHLKQKASSSFLLRTCPHLGLVRGLSASQTHSDDDDDEVSFPCGRYVFLSSRSTRPEMSAHPPLPPAGAVAAPELSPPPLGLLTGEEGGRVRISCFAPRSYAGSTFELFGVGASHPAQSVSAEPGQSKVDFVLDGAAPGSRCYRCRYRSYNGSAWQSSDFSMEIMVNASADTSCTAPAVPSGLPQPTAMTLRQARPWILPVALSVAGLVLLVVAVAVAARRGSGRRAGRRRDTPRQSFPMRTAPSPSPWKRAWFSARRVPGLRGRGALCGAAAVSAVAPLCCQ